MLSVVRRSTSNARIRFEEASFCFATPRITHCGQFSTARSHWAFEEADSERLRISAGIIKQRGAPNFATDQILDQLAEGKRVMDAIRVSVAEIQQAQRAGLQGRSTAAQRDAKNTQWLGALGTIVSLTILFYVFMVVQHEGKQRRNTEARLRALNTSMEMEIEERRNAEDRARENAAVLDLFVQHAPVAVAMFDTQMCYLQTSTQWLRDYRLEDANILGLSHYEVFPDIPERWKEDHRRVLQGETIRANEDCFPRADGTIEWLQYVLCPWYRADSKVGGLIMFTQVITARKEAERIQNTEREFLKALLDSLNASVMACDEKGNLTLCNRVARELHNQAPGTMVEQWVQSGSLHKSDGVTPLPEHELPLSRALRGENVQDYELIVKSQIVKSQEVAHTVISANAQPIVDSAGQLLGAVSVGHDITERRHIEEALRYAEQRLTAILTNLPVIVFAVDAKGIFTLSEGLGLYKLGIQPGAVVGQSVYEIYQDYPEITTNIRRVLDGRAASWTAQFGDVHLETQCVPLRDSRGNVVGATGVSVDLTERREFEEQQKSQVNGLRSVLSAADELLNQIDLDSVLRRGVELMRERLGLERCAIF
jgi:PAS domain S-box-containing protein